MHTVDSHQHCWQLDHFDYGWIASTNMPLHRDRLPEDLRPHMRSAGIERSILVHAADTAEEIPWLLSLCNEHPYIAGVVGHVDLTSRSAAAGINGFARDVRFKGVRLNLPFAPRDGSLIDTSLHALAGHNLSCDLLLGPGALAQATELAKAHPNLIFVLDHLAGARITQGGEADFASALEPFAVLSNTVMKLSGYLTASGGLPMPAVARALQPYLDVSLNLFGPQRLMFGSDWPVCTQRGTYADAVNTLRTLTLALSADEQALIWGDTAARVYRL